MGNTKMKYLVHCVISEINQEVVGWLFDIKNLKKTRETEKICIQDGKILFRQAEKTNSFWCTRIENQTRTISFV